MHPTVHNMLLNCSTRADVTVPRLETAHTVYFREITVIGNDAKNWIGHRNHYHKLYYLLRNIHAEVMSIKLAWYFWKKTFSPYGKSFSNEHRVVEIQSTYSQDFTDALHDCYSVY